MVIPRDPMLSRLPYKVDGHEKEEETTDRVREIY
jgi:hypothetical protein